MLSIKIVDITHFMNLLLKEDTFDRFLLKEATVKTEISYIIAGKINQGFYDTEEQEEIRGKKIPLQEVFQPNVEAFFLIILLLK